MLADFYIPRLSNEMKLGGQKIILSVKFCTEVWTLLKNGVEGKFKGHFFFRSTTTSKNYGKEIWKQNPKKCHSKSFPYYLAR